MSLLGAYVKLFFYTQQAGQVRAQAAGRQELRKLQHTFRLFLELIGKMQISRSLYEKRNFYLQAVAYAKNSIQFEWNCPSSSSSWQTRRRSALQLFFTAAHTLFSRLQQLVKFECRGVVSSCSCMDCICASSSCCPRQANSSRRRQHGAPVSCSPALVRPG